MMMGQFYGVDLIEKICFPLKRSKYLSFQKKYVQNNKKKNEQDIR